MDNVENHVGHLKGRPDFTALLFYMGCDRGFPAASGSRNTEDYLEFLRSLATRGAIGLCKGHGVT